MRYIRKKKSYNFSQEDFLRMAKYGVYCFGEETKEETEVPKYDRDVVEKGQTLSHKAKEWGTTVDKIVALNNIEDPDKIPAGFEFNVPEDSKYTKYTYQKGDTGMARAKATGEKWNDYSSRNSHISDWTKMPVGGWTWELRAQPIVKEPEKLNNQPVRQTQSNTTSNQPQSGTKTWNTDGSDMRYYAPNGNGFDYIEYFKDQKTPLVSVDKNGYQISGLKNHNPISNHPQISEKNKWYGVYKNLDTVYDEMIADPEKFFRATKQQLITLPREIFDRNGFKDYFMPFIRQESNDDPKRFDLLSANISPKDWSDDKALWGLSKGGAFKSQLDGLRKGIPMLVAKGFNGTFIPPNQKKVTYFEPYHKVAKFWNGNKDKTEDGKVFMDEYARKIEELRRNKLYYDYYDSTIKRP